MWRTEEVALVPVVQQASEAQPTEDEQQQFASFQMPAADEYEDIRLRPLFNRSRRPETPRDISQAGDASDGKGTPAAQISLNGVVLTRVKRVALLRLDNDPKVMHVAEGQRAGGWLIEAVRPDRIVLRRGDTASEIALDYKRRDGGGGAQVGVVERAPNGNPASSEQEESR